MIHFQSLLFHFLFIFIFSTKSIHATNVTDLQALVAFKQSILQHSVKDTLTSWNDSSHFCQWEGVTCGRRHLRVTSISLESKSLAGPLSPYIGNLSFLQLLDLYNNSFEGAIPSQLGHLFRLKKVDLNHNKFNGSIPSNISGCLNVEYIDFAHNSLTGELPKELAALPLLSYFIVHLNHFTGGIPDFLGNITSLAVISAADNPFGGTIPDSLGQLKNLNYLALGGNNLSGIIPPSFYNLSSIANISLDENQLEGPLLPTIGLKFPSLQYFQVSFNQLTGNIPPSFSNCSDLVNLQLAANFFDGKIALDFGGLANLKYIRLSNNLFGRGEADEMSFIDSVTNCSILDTLELGSNKLKGSLPNSVANLSSKLAFLNLQVNQFHGRLPSAIGNLVGLTNLLVDRNRFTGTIPSSIGNLKKLERLWLQENDFSGVIPDSIGRLSMLLELHMEMNQIEGIIPTSLENCQRMSEMDVSQNNLSGHIPSQLFTVTTLSSLLNLSGNHFNGSLPSNVGNLRNLASLDLSNNGLSGKLPTSLGSCSSLEYLFLQNNIFQGQIPSSLSSLRGVRNLDISHNNLSGKIPIFLEKFTLQYLNLSYNNFDGELPLKGIFANQSGVSVVGNKGLCGGLPEFHLHKCSIKNQGRSRIFIIVFSTMSVFICASAILIILLSWRRKKTKETSSGALMKEPFLRVSYEMLLKATDGYSAQNMVGRGSSGYVYKGLLDGYEKIVAIKVLNLQSRGASQSFMNECEALRTARHRNLLKIITSCSSIDFQGNDFKALVYDFMPNGSLESWLHSSPGAEDELPRQLNLQQRIDIAIDVACGLDYLHHRCENPIIHCDLKPSNILLDDDMVAHVGDFGLAKLFRPENTDETHNSSVGLRGTTGYAAPEYGLGGELSTSGDVYSFGILLLEMITGKRPTDDMFTEGLNLHNFAKMALPEHVKDIADPLIFQGNVATTQAGQEENGRTRHDTVTECLTSVLKIGVACSMEAPQARMGITNVFHELNAIKNIMLQH